MTNTALRAENSNSCTITFKSKEHENFIWNIWKNADIRMSIIRLWFIAWVSTETQEIMWIKSIILKLDV